MPSWRSYNRKLPWSEREYCMAMSQETVDIVRALIAAYSRRDFQAAAEAFDPEIEWVLPDGQSSDSCRGPDDRHPRTSRSAWPGSLTRCGFGAASTSIRAFLNVPQRLGR